MNIIIIFEEAYETYLNFISMKLKSTSKRTLKSRIDNYILPYFKNKKISDITPNEYLKWKLKIDNFDISIKQKNNLHHSFSNFLDFCILFYNLQIQNVSKILGKFNDYDISNTKEFEVWNINEYQKFIDVVDDQVYKVLFEFLFKSGVRIGEALALTFDDIHNNQVSINKTISKENYNGRRLITTPKSKNSVRIITIDNTLENELSKLREQYIIKNKNFTTKFFVFGGEHALSNTTVERKKNNYCKIANVKKIRLHDFRHSHATFLYQQNVPIKAISERLGHSSVAITIDTYVKSSLEDEKRILSILNSIP